MLISKDVDQKIIKELESLKKKNLVLLSGLTLSFVFAMSSVALGYNGIYPSATNQPTNKNMTPGVASTTMFGDVQKGLQVYNANCQSCHGPATAPKGIGSVTSSDPELAVDPGLYDINPAIFARDLDPMLQHGSKPADAAPITMPAFGDTGSLPQNQIADVEAWIMSNSNVKWPTLALDGTTINGSGFVPGSTVQLYQNGTALNGTAAADANGKFSISGINLPTGQEGKITANYAVLNVQGISTADKKQPDLALDGTKGATYTVAAVNYGPSVATANMPKTGSNSLTLAALGAALLGFGALITFRKPRLNK